MLKILLLKLFFVVCALFVCINIFELIPHQILSFDFFTQLSLLIICIGFFMVLKLIYAELSGDFPLGDSRQPTYKSLRPFDLVS